MTPISVRVVGTDLDNVRVHAHKVAEQMKCIPYLRDIDIEQEFDYPAIRVDIDREKAGLSDIKVREASEPLIEATSSSRFIALNYWIDVRTRLRLSDRSAGAAQVHDQQRRDRKPSAWRRSIPGEPDDSGRGDRAKRHDARRDRPRRLTALFEHQRQCRRRGHGPRVAASLAGH